jgi:UDP-N-acetylglucosamine 2-epimerase (non-hydrolysing)
VRFTLKGYAGVAGFTDSRAVSRSPRVLRVLSVVGTRPEAIKMAPVVLALEARDDVQHRLCVTAQHRQMLDEVLDLFGPEPAFDLDIMGRASCLHESAAEIMRGLAPVLADERPDWVVVQGDTTTAAIGAVAAFYAGARVAHVEAGLRTHNTREPFPEEVNRRIAGVVTELHLAPTSAARDNLLREGVAPSTVVVTGNPVIDALHLARTMPLPPGSIAERLPPGRRIVLLTTHRRESFGPPLESICAAVADLTRLAPDIHVVIPVHPNPAVSQTVRDALADNPSVTLLEPLGYRELVGLLERCSLVLTDSGGLQEEAPSLGNPVLVLRDVTERAEGVAAGTVRLVGTDRARIVDETLSLLGSPGEMSLMSRRVNPYGDGRAAERIVDALLGLPVQEWAPVAAPTDEPLRIADAASRPPVRARLRDVTRGRPLRGAGTTSASSPSPAASDHA